MKGVQCYELFGGVALKNNTFSFHFISFLLDVNVRRLIVLGSDNVGQVVCDFIHETWFCQRISLSFVHFKFVGNVVQFHFYFFTNWFQDAVINQHCLFLTYTCDRTFVPNS